MTRLLHVVLALAFLASCSGSGAAAPVTSSTSTSTPSAATALPATTLPATELPATELPATALAEPTPCTEAVLPVDLYPSYQPGEVRDLLVNYSLQSFTDTDLGSLRTGGTSISRVALTAVALTDDGWQLRWEDRVGQKIHDYSSQLPTTAEDRIDIERVVAVDYLLRLDGTIELLSDEEALAAEYQTVQDLLFIDTPLPPTVSSDALIGATSMAILEPSLGPLQLRRLIETYHHGTGRTVSADQTETELRWPYPFSFFPIADPVATTAETRERNSCLSVEDELLGSITADVADFEWTYGQWISNWDAKRQLPLAAFLNMNGIGIDGERLAHNVSIVDSEWSL